MLTQDIHLTITFFFLNNSKKIFKKHSADYFVVLPFSNTICLISDMSVAFRNQNINSPDCIHVTQLGESFNRMYDTYVYLRSIKISTCLFVKWVTQSFLYTSYKARRQRSGKITHCPCVRAWTSQELHLHACIIFLIKNHIENFVIHYYMYQ